MRACASLLVALSACAMSVGGKGLPDGGSPATCSPDPAPVTAIGGWPQLSVTGDTGSTEGIFDPSLAYAPDAGTGFLTYSSVPDQAGVHTRLAASSNHGATWTFVEDVNEATSTTLTTSDSSLCGSTTCAGEWVHETSSLVIDPGDPDPSQRFKVFTHSYFATATSLEYTAGVISMFTSPQPGSGAWQEQAVLGWTSSSPISSTARQNVNTDPALAPGLGDCVLLTEPGALVRGDTLDLAVGCARVDPDQSVPIEIKLLRSTDHGRSWSFVSTLVSEADAVAMGAQGRQGPQVNAADLFVVDDQEYVFVSPNGDVAAGATTLNGYRGCIALPFDDVDSGTLERCDGALVVASQYLGPTGTFLGACTAAEGATATGVLSSIASFTAGGPGFRIFASRLGPP